MWLELAKTLNRTLILPPLTYARTDYTVLADIDATEIRRTRTGQDLTQYLWSLMSRVANKQYTHHVPVSAWFNISLLNSYHRVIE